MANEELICEDLVEIIIDYLEGQMLQEQRTDFEQHIGRCSGCAAYVAQMKATIRLIGRLGHASSITPATRRNLLHAFREFIDRD